MALKKGGLLSDLNGDGLVDEVLVVGSKDELSAIWNSSKQMKAFCI
jgi:hypothetical protein